MIKSNARSYEKSVLGGVGEHKEVAGCPDQSKHGAGVSELKRSKELLDDSIAPSGLWRYRYNPKDHKTLTVRLDSKLSKTFLPQRDLQV